MLPMVPGSVKTLLAIPCEKQKLIPTPLRRYQLARQSHPDKQIFRHFLSHT